MKQPVWTDPLLDAMRGRGDRLADLAVAELFAKNEVTTTNQLLRQLVDNDDVPQAELPEPIHTFLADTAVLPPWADPDKLQLGSHLFGRCAPQIVMILFCYSLPVTYTAGKGAETLYRTAKMTANLHRRIVETAQFVIDVMEPQAFAAQGQGIRSIQKTRLVHAGVRHLIEVQGNWQQKTERPINQEDLAGTLLAFSYIVLDGLQKLGVALSDNEREAYMHRWRVIGHLLGIDGQLLPASFAEAQRLTETILNRQFAPGEAGRAMTQALVEWLQDMMPGKRFDGMVVTLMRFFCGDKTADNLGLGAADWTEGVLRPLQTLVGFFDQASTRGQMGAQLTRHLGWALLEGWIYLEGEGKPVQVRIPSALRRTWHNR